MTKARQTTAVTVTFMKSNKSSLEHQAVAYQSSRKKCPIYMNESAYRQDNSVPISTDAQF